MANLEKLVRLFEQGRISRREFIAKVSALGLAAAVSPMLLSGKAKAAQPKKGGRFRLGLGQGATTDSLDPGKLPSTAPQMVHMQVRNCLVELDYQYKPVPELAESWESTPDATQGRRLQIIRQSSRDSG
jgi:peptide/nickel transport system substrate-binding protein